MNDTEKLLRSWVPRRPSAKLERRLFPASPPADEPAAPLRLYWLAPATAALLFMGLFLNQHFNPALSSANPVPIVAVALSNLSAAAYLPGSFPREHNPLPDEAYEMNLGRGTGASINPVADSRRRR